MTVEAIDLDTQNMTPAELALGKQVAEALHDHYPGHLWAVNVERGLVTVMNLALSGRWGFVLHQAKVQGDPDMKEVMRAGGELLERYNVARGAATERSYSKVQYDQLTGLPVPEAG